MSEISASVSLPCSHQAYLQGSVTFSFFCRGKPIAEKLSTTPRITQLLSDQLSEISLPSWRKEDWVPHLTKAAGNQSPVGNASSQIMMPSGRSQTFLRWVGRQGGPEITEQGGKHEAEEWNHVRLFLLWAFLPLSISMQALLLCLDRRCSMFTCGSGESWILKGRRST